ncbi:MAG: protein-tyrosine phosphatase [Syntrophaceae bacterium]|nr:protein-tyrosine phosphatase [Syntrophaceae bacterium]
MIDLHAHILPGLDDGAKTLEQSIEMCRISYRDGVRTIVATPHNLNGLYLNDRETILAKVRELNKAVKKFGVEGSKLEVHSTFGNPHSAIVSNSELQTLNSKLRILPGSDVHLSEKTLSFLDEGRLMTIGDGNKYLFLEFPSQGIPYGSEEIIFKLMSRGIIPVITHPERNLEIGQRPQRYHEMVRMGCLGQITAMSLTGDFGPRVKQIAEELLIHRLVHFIASDAHSTGRRSPVLSEGVKAAERIIGEEAHRMVTEYPQAILEGRKLCVAEPVPI